MPSLIKRNDKRFFENFRTLYDCLTSRRRFQLLVLFILQIASAVSEVVSLGAIIPFLSAMTNASRLMQNATLAPFLEFLNITEPNQLIVTAAFLFALAIVIANSLRFLTLWVQLYLSAVIGTDLGKILFKNTIYSHYSFFLTHNSNQLIGNITNDLRSTLSAVQNSFSLVAQVMVTLAITAGLLAYNTTVALALFLTTFFAYALIITVIKKRLTRNSVIVSDSYRNMVQILQEGFGGIKDVILHKVHSTFLNRYEKSDRIFRRSGAEITILTQAPRFFVEAVGVVAISVLAMIFATQKQDISKVIPLLGFLGLGCYRLLPAVQQVYSSLGTLYGQRASLDRTCEILKFSHAPSVPASQSIPLDNEIKFENIWFSYKENPDPSNEEDWVIKNLSFSIKPKTTVALVGHTGSGKSTVSDLLLGLIQPQKGQILIGGKLLDSETIETWQQSISHVPQHIFLMDCSIAENIAFGVPREQIDMSRLIEAAASARIDSFIQTLPLKYDETAGERGVRLSGGQRQRIGIARALYQKKSFVIFDEATSALDNTTEIEVMNAIAALSKDMTVVLIAHRLSSIEKADTIFLLDNGTLAAQGSYQQLLATSESFENLFRGIAREEQAA